MTDEANVTWLLLKTYVRAKYGLIKLSDGYNLSAIQALTVCLLEPEKAVAMNTISDMLACDASNVTNIVDRLVENDYIDRKTSKADRRVNTITLTDKGIKVRSEILEKLSRGYLSSIQLLSQHEKEIFKKLLVKILSRTDITPL
jgi:DNA-binding MarR family transcriptional regulator